MVEGNSRAVDFELSEEQVALRDGARQRVGIGQQAVADPVELQLGLVGGVRFAAELPHLALGGLAVHTQERDEGAELKPAGVQLAPLVDTSGGFSTRLLDGEFNSILASPLRFLCSLDHLIRPLKHTDWNCQTYLFRRLKVDHKFKLRRLLHRQISRFGAFQDLVHVNGRVPKEVFEVRPVGHETARIDKLRRAISAEPPP